MTASTDSACQSELAGPRDPGYADLRPFCQDLFTSFARSDQRRWGEIYVHGLASIPGRKSVRRIAEHVVGRRVDQCLQQFVSQSPWAWAPVRLRLAHHVAAMLRPVAWVATEAVFPKNGDNSVGVAKQYAQSTRGVLNCQLGLTVMLAGDAGSCPVNWRLMLPRAWDDDTERRARTRLPSEERHQSRWAHLLDAIDEMTLDWDLPAAPIVLDAHQEPQVGPLLAGLEERRLHYLVRIPDTTTVSIRPGTAPVTVAEVVSQSANSHVTTLAWPDHANGRPTRSQFVAVSLSAGLGQIGSGWPRFGLRRLVTDWPPGRRSRCGIWLTNLHLSRLPDLVHLITLAQRTDGELERMGDECGLWHFEGRSYPGWHHHVTLASVAHAYRLLYAEGGREPAPPPRTHADAPARGRLGVAGRNTSAGRPPRARPSGLGAPATGQPASGRQASGRASDG
jgi:SRSO17 transposase